MVAEVCRTPETAKGRRNSMASRLRSPTFRLGSNDDKLERAQARAAARAAAARHKLATNGVSSGDAPRDLLDEGQIIDLFHNCIKLASENKINQKNTWELGLIDHLSELVRARPEDDDETNFQKASCTLEAGVKIYAMRVDSVHSEAYKVLGGINRAGRGEEKESVEEGDIASSPQAEGLSKKDMEKKISPMATLESSFEALNVKKLDVAFAVDPLYHQTSAQFDEGGAKGLLLNNLGVYGLCSVLFDSFEIPENVMLREKQKDRLEPVDLSFAKDCIEKMVTCMPKASDISPTLRDIVNMFDEDNFRPSAENISVEMPTGQDDLLDNNNMDLPENSFADDYGSCNVDPDDHDDQSSTVDEMCTSTFNDSTNNHVENFDYMSDGPEMNEKTDAVYNILSLGLGLSSKSNAWAGPDHWKYCKSKGSVHLSASSTESGATTKKQKNKKGAPDLDFTKSLESEISDIFAPPKNPKSLLLSAKKTAHDIYLPEDCHYKPETLVKLFVLPNVMCLAKRIGRPSDDSIQGNDYTDPSQSWDDETIDHFGDGNTYSDPEEPVSLVPQPRQVRKVDVKYDKVSKQVDVHVLKNSLWDHIKVSAQCFDKEDKTAVSLKRVLQQFWEYSPADSAREISPHLFFICLLHLANEHCLSLHAHSNLEELDIGIPSSALVE